MDSLLDKKSVCTEQFSLGDYVSYALKGIYHIEHIETLSLTGAPDRYYVLSHAFNKTIHKTFVPVKTAVSMGMRLLADKNVFEQLEEIVSTLELQPEEMGKNSNKKIKYYEDRIKKRGLSETIHCFFCVDHDLKMTKREDKRYVQFLERLRKLICAEISLVSGEVLGVCQERFDAVAKKYQSL